MRGEIPVSALCPDPREQAARLQSLLPVEGSQKQLEELMQAVTCRYTALRVPIHRQSGLELGFGAIHSRHLQKNLVGCEEAFLFAVTLGLGVDRYLNRCAALSGAKHFIADALASALAEAAAEEAEKRIKGSLCCNPRFSPGYGDLPLELQKPLLTLLEAQKIGITLNQNLLMVPTKSITAIMGIKQ